MGPTELLIIAGIIILLFGATKLPQMARSLGQSARVFKAEARGMREDEEAAKQDKETSGEASRSEPHQLTSGEQGSSRISSSHEDTQRDNAKN
ncbi:Sec-independent protein translocase subunit TatA [Halopolyspora algeriensis]|nr:Sec-independent protein translocase subunit TatA [Halopolyspora algeriensis]